MLINLVKNFLPKALCGLQGRQLETLLVHVSALRGGGHAVRWPAHEGAAFEGEGGGRGEGEGGMGAIQGMGGWEDRGGEKEP